MYAILMLTRESSRLIISPLAAALMSYTERFFSVIFSFHLIYFELTPHGKEYTYKLCNDDNEEYRYEYTHNVAGCHTTLLVGVF